MGDAESEIIGKRSIFKTPVSRNTKRKS